MNPRLRQTLAFVASACIAVWVGGDLAGEQYFWPTLLLFVAIAASLVRVSRLPLDTVVLGMVVFGYLVGNRGFAQLMVSRYIPLLPAEAALAFTAGWAIFACAREKRLPWSGSLLDWCVLAWLAAGTARVAFDVKGYGFEALRDYATVYYAAFYFVTKRIARNSSAQSYLMATAVVGFALLPVLNALWETVPDLFYSFLRVRGVPIILFKGDLAYMFQAGAAAVLFHWARGRHRYWAWPYAAVLFLEVMIRESRASIVGAVLTLVLLAAARRWAYPILQSAAIGVALASMLIVLTFTDNPWIRHKLTDAEEQVRSIINPVLLVSHQSNANAYKWDNNRFRLVWWYSVFEETVSTNPVFGLGFGYDLARNFVHEYSPDVSDDFTARSPHSIIMTSFGRMGAVGLAIWLLLSVALVREAWVGIARTVDPVLWGLWCAILIVLISASLGVVLEGPMGAVPFWVFLGLASTRTSQMLAAAADSPTRSLDADALPEPAETVAPSA